MGGGSSCYYATPGPSLPLLAASPSSMKKETMSTVGTMSTNDSMQQDEWTSSNHTDSHMKQGNMLALDEVLNMPLTTKDMLEHEIMMSRSEELLGWEVSIEGLGVGYIESIVGISKNNMVVTLLQMRDGRQFVLPLVSEEDDPNSDLQPAEFLHQAT